MHIRAARVSSMNIQPSELLTAIQSVNAAPDIPDRRSDFNIKNEPEDTVLDSKLALHEYADTDYTSHQYARVVTEENKIADDGNDPILCNILKEERLEESERSRDTPTHQENPGMCTALHSLQLKKHKERLESICRVQLWRLDTFHCEVCDAVYTDVHKLQQHVQGMHVHGPGGIKGRRQCTTDAQRGKRKTQRGQKAQPRLYRCDKCEKVFTHERAFHAHCKCEHGYYECVECKAKYENKAPLLRHVRNVHNKQEYQCTVCTKMYISKEARNQHVSRCHRSAMQCLVSSHEVYTCDYCQRTYPSRHKHSLVLHIQSAHGNVIHRCSECKAKFKNNKYLQKHIKYVHSKKEYACEFCNKVFKTKEYNTKHVRHVHLKKKRAGSKLRIYICDICQKTFTKKKSVTSHFTSVHASGSYKCSQCDKNFKCEQYLMSHIGHVHTAVSEPSVYICAYCQKTFAFARTLRRHFTCVHASGSYKCSHCKMSFKCEQYLVSHISDAHTAGKKACNVRGKFVRPYNLGLHMLNMHSDDKCKLCGKAMKSKKYLRRHLSDFHFQPSAVTTLSHHRSTCYNLRKGFKSKWRRPECERRGKCSSPGVGDPNEVLNASTEQHNVAAVKDEPADEEIELGPVVFQHMDCNYRPYKEEPQLE